MFETCYDFIESLPGLIHDESNPESVNTLGNDHLADATRYAIMSKPLIPKKPKTGIPQFSFEYWLQRKENLDRQKGYVGTL